LSYIPSVQNYSIAPRLVSKYPAWAYSDN